ncbi:MAG: hypothetical protein IKU56_01405 [Clostridia bacterium]|nr:hypothetical protein [Clostridia bacterium]
MDELTKVSESVKSAHHRLDTLEQEMRDIHTLAAALSETNSDVKHLREDVREIKADVKAAAQRPAKQWDKLIAALIAAAVSAVLAILVK